MSRYHFCTSPLWSITNRRFRFCYLALHYPIPKQVWRGRKEVGRTKNKVRWGAIGIQIGKEEIEEKEIKQLVSKVKQLEEQMVVNKEKYQVHLAALKEKWLLLLSPCTSNWLPSWVLFFFAHLFLWLLVWEHSVSCHKQRETTEARAMEDLPHYVAAPAKSVRT